MTGPTTTSAAHSIASLESEVASLAEDLYELFAESFSDDDAAAVARGEAEALDRYARRIGRIATVAGSNGYKALNGACVAFQDRLDALTASGAPLNAAQRDLLEALPMQLMACLSVPPDPLAVDTLLALLCNPEWSDPLTEVEAATLREGFLPEAVDASPADVTTHSHDSVPHETADSDVAGDRKGGPGPDRDSIAGLQRELAEIMDGLLNAMATAGDAPDAAASALEAAAERTELMGVSAAAAGFVGIMDACMLFQAALLSLAGRAESIGADAAHVLGQWTERLDAYMCAPMDPEVADALIDYIATLPWGNPLGEAERVMLRKLLLPEQVEPTSEPAVDIDGQPDHESPVAVQEEEGQFRPASDVGGEEPTFEIPVTGFDVGDEGVSYGQAQDEEAPEGIELPDDSAGAQVPDFEGWAIPDQMGMAPVQSAEHDIAADASLDDTLEEGALGADVNSPEGSTPHDEATELNGLPDTLPSEQATNFQSRTTLGQMDADHITSAEYDAAADASVEELQEEGGSPGDEGRSSDDSGSNEEAAQPTGWSSDLLWGQVPERENPSPLDHPSVDSAEPASYDAPDENPEEGRSESPDHQEYADAASHGSDNEEHRTTWDWSDVTDKDRTHRFTHSVTDDRVGAAADETEQTGEDTNSNDQLLGEPTGEHVSSTEEAVVHGQSDGRENVTEDGASSLTEVVIGEQARELIELLSVELEACVGSLNEQLARAIDLDADREIRRDALDEYLAQLEPFVLAAESLGLVGLSEALSCLQENLQALRDAAILPEGLNELLRVWPVRVLGYLNVLGAPDCAKPLLALLTDTRWPHPLAESEVPDLEERLVHPQLLTDEDEVEPRQTVARPEDVSLILPEDVNAQLLESLLQELPNETAEFTETISRMLAGNADLEELDRAQRIAHTLKGSANTVGVIGIATLTHHIEDILLAFSKHQHLPGAALLEVLIDAADVLEMMSEALVGAGAAPDQSQAVLQRVLDWANRIDFEGLPEDDAAPAEGSAPSRTSQDETSAPAAKGDTPAARSESAVPMLRVPATLVDELLRLAGESIILNGQLQDRLQHALRQTDAAREQNRLVQQLVVELEELVDVQGLNSPQARAGLYEKFDALELEQYNELHTVTHRLVEATTDARELTHGVQDQLDGLAGMLVDQGRLNRESQEVVMRARMVPVQNIVPRLQRSVRQTGRLTGKQAHLEVSGVDTLMDSDVLNELTDPLMHILRNAIDHGIESPEVRTAAGKDPIGQIDLSFYREGDHIVLRCRDDGAGLDLERIRHTARERGLIDAAAEPDDEALMRLVWLPGFTTRDVTTQTSGRGIGMDAVYTRVTELKGALNIDSQTGKGCTVELRLPLTLISVHALLVGTQGQTLAVSTRGVEQILHPGDGTVEREAGHLYCRLGDTRYEAHFLETLLHRSIRADAAGEAERPVLLVRGETGRTSAVLVERVSASQDLVVKQLGHYLPAIAGIEGATILGDGSIAPVLDLAGLLRTAAPDEVTELAGRLAEEQGVGRLPCALVVDDSLSARRSLAQFVQDAGYEVRTARDGLEAIDVIADRAPDILLVDLEMPRMNGLELTAHVRARADLREVPVIMITSRSTEKHRQQAEEVGVDVYLTKPFSEDDLLGHITERLASA